MEYHPIETSVPAKNRIKLLQQAVFDAKPAICPERALLWTEYFKKDPTGKNMFTYRWLRRLPMCWRTRLVRFIRMN